MNKYVVEFIGTFFLVLTIGCTVINGGNGVVPPLAIGSALMVMIFAGGHISGGHYNPAVTLGVWLRGKCEAKDVAPYMIFQVMGAMLAALVVKFLKGGATVAPAHSATIPAFLAEFLFTFALVYVVLNVATAKGTSGNSFYGLAIGFTVLAGAFSVGNISGGVFNPAVAAGISVMGLSSWANL
jgi:aquaporin Z